MPLNRQFEIKPGLRFPPRQRIQNMDDLKRIEFVDDMAEVDVPIELLDQLPLKNEGRTDSGRLRQVMRAIRQDGYNSLDPVVVRIGRRGRWVVVDGGHRITAARLVAKEFFTNLMGPKVREIQFLVYRTSLTGTRLAEPEPGGDGETRAVPDPSNR
jgi:hypothetical protein